MIAQGFPPLKSMGSIRNYKVGKEYLKYFEKVSVITSSDKDSWSKDDGLDLSAFNMNLVGSFCVHSILGKCSDSIKFNSKRRQSRFSNIFRRVVRSFPFNLFLNGGGVKYILEGYKKGVQLIENEGIEYIHTSYPPMTDHAIGWLLKRKFPHLTWIADFRDMMVEDMRRDIILPQLQHFFLKKIISKADIVTTVSQGLTENLSQYGKPVHVLFNGIPNESLPVAEVVHDKFTISYTGSIYKNLQKPQLLFSAISSLIESGKISKDNIQFLYRGKDKQLWEAMMEKNNLLDIFNAIPSQVSVEQSRALQRASHINLLLSWSSNDYKGILTGKMYDYMAAGKPVALIINGVQDDEFESIFEKTQLGEVFYHQKSEMETIKQFILKYYSEWQRTGKVQPVVDEQGLSDFRIENIMQDFVSNQLGLDAKKMSLPIYYPLSFSKIAS